MNVGYKPLIALALFLVTVAAVLMSSKPNKVNAFQVGAVPGSLEALANDCIEHNLQSVTIPTYELRYEGVSGIDEAASVYSIVIAHPLSKRSFVLDSESQMIQSWYTFVVTEVLSLKPFNACSECPASPDPPTTLMPLGPSQLLVPKNGGSVTVNGVIINSIDDVFPDYQMSQNYLLFLRMDSSKRVGLVSLGPAAVFTISANGTLGTVAEGSDNALAHDITQRYGNSVASLRAALNP